MDGETADLGSGETMDASEDSRAPVGHREPDPQSPAVDRSRDRDYVALLGVDPEHYIIGDELARGGMGRIVRAHDRRLGRDVAIKELLPRHDDLRFEREARITARLAHPAIVAIHEAGRWPSGAPFFAMKLVAGMSLDKVIIATTSFSERLALVSNVITAVDALAYAHSERVIHRDLKPANVLVGKYGETVVIDWGLAKDLDTVDDSLDVDDPDYEPKEGETVIGAVMGTPSYMSPEQAEGDRVDARTDVYALGALLYHVLAGGAPYEGKSTAEVLERVLAEPPPPLAQRAPEVPMELIAIVDRAMARDLAARFQDAGEMAEELRRFQTGQLIKSHRYTARELVRRWVQRNRTPIAVGVVAVLTLAMVGVASLAKIVSETHRADREASIANERADRGTLDRARSLLEEDPAQAIAALRELSPGSQHWREARMIVADAASRGISRVMETDGHVPVGQLVWNADGTRIAATVGHELMVWDPNNRVPYRLATASDQVSIGWDGDAILHADVEGQVSRWRPFQGGDEPVERFEDAKVSISPNASWLVVIDRMGDRGALVERSSKRQRSLGRTATVGWEVNSEAVLVYDERSFEVRRTELATGAMTSWRLESVDAQSAVGAFGSTGFISNNQNELIELGGAVRPTGFAAPASHVAVLPDGRAVAITNNNADPSLITAENLADNEAEGSVAISDGSTAVVKLHGHRAPTVALAVSSRGTIASADQQGQIRIWTLMPILHSETVPVVAAFIDLQHTQIVAMEHEAAAHIPLATGIPTVTTNRVGNDGQPQPGNLGDEIVNSDAVTVARSASGAEWVTMDHSSRGWLWNRTRGLRLCPPDQAKCEKLDFATISADGSRAAGIVGGVLSAWDGHTGAWLPFEPVKTFSATAISLSPDGRTVALAEHHDEDKPVSDRIVLYSATGKLLDQIDIQHGSSITTMTFSPDGQHLAAALASSVQLYDLTSRPRLERTFIGHEREIASIAFANHGEMITTSNDSTARIWNLADGTAKVLRGHTKLVRTIDVAGESAVTTSYDGTARFWDLVTEKSRLLPGHAAPPVFAAFSATGDIVTLDLDGRLSHYTDNVPWGEAGLRGWIDALTNTRN